MTVVGRIAPSPTGQLHLGHARSFLLAWWSARAQGGRVVLRIDDLDPQRTVPGSADRILEDLSWLGLDWDGAPLYQSTRTKAYESALGRLERQGALYPCVCTRKEIASAVSAPHDTDGERPYPGTCLRDPSRADQAPAGSKALRYRVVRGPIGWRDRLMGPVEVDVARTAGDFVVARRDGVASYQLATAVDDAYQGVTEVVRGEDLMPSAARQMLLARDLGLTIPEQAHVRLVVDHRGERLAKRDGAVTLGELRRAGVTPERICQWAARSAGLTATAQPRPAKFWVSQPMIESEVAGPVRLPPRLSEDL